MEIFSLLKVGWGQYVFFPFLKIKSQDGKKMHIWKHFFLVDSEIVKGEDDIFELFAPSSSPLCICMIKHYLSCSVHLKQEMLMFNI